MEKELEIQKAKYINDRSYIALTVMAQNQQQKYIELLTEKDAEVANKEMADKLINEYLPSIENILGVLASMEEEAADFTDDLKKLYKAAVRLAHILRVRFGTLLDFLAGEEEDGKEGEKEGGGWRGGALHEEGPPLSSHCTRSLTFILPCSSLLQPAQGSPPWLPPGPDQHPARRLHPLWLQCRLPLGGTQHGHLYPAPPGLPPVE